MNIPQNFTVAVLGVIPESLDGKADKYLLNILFTAALKSITISWMKAEPPSYNTWIQKVWDIYQMEQITYWLRLQKTIFTKRREPILKKKTVEQYNKEEAVFSPLSLCTSLSKEITNDSNHIKPKLLRFDDVSGS
uniref:Uncharacterized protein n=1 Tax=Sphaeramia orbicularis TaxID=375764 RepID=A0A672YVJ1_9TELE